MQTKNSIVSRMAIRLGPLILSLEYSQWKAYRRHALYVCSRYAILKVDTILRIACKLIFVIPTKWQLDFRISFVYESLRLNS